VQVAIHQPEHLPWLGFFHKILAVDLFVLLDNVQFEKNYFQNRNKIRTTDGWSWLTIPASYTMETKIHEVKISYSPRWKKKWYQSLFFSYKKAPFFEYYFQPLMELINKNWDYLSDLNIALIQILCDFLSIKVKMIRASELGVQGKSSALIASICKEVGAQIYLSGVSGKDYLKMADFDEIRTKVFFQEFHHPIYRQLHEPFIPCMSIVDLLFNHGEKSLEIINGKDVSVISELYL
jgi:hypothetical protein